MAEPIFDLQNIYKTRPGAEHYRLEIRRFVVRKGETIALIGPSGCGKSTALDLLACALRPNILKDRSKQHFLFAPAPGEKRDVLSCWLNGGPNALAGARMRYLGYVLQTGGLLPFLTAVDNIMLASKVLNVVHERAGAIASICKRLGITPLLKKYQAALSVGERQRVAIARALAHRPTVVLADEPTAALDPAHSAAVMKLFLEIAREEGSTFIVVSHDQRLVSELGFTLVPVTVQASEGGVTASLSYGGAAC